MMRVDGVGAEGKIGSGGEVSARCDFLHRSIMVAAVQQSANMLGNRLVLLKLENSIIISNI